MFLGHRDTSDLISMVVFTFAMRRHCIRLASGPFISFRLAKFGWVAFADRFVQRLAAKQNTKFTEGARKFRSYINPFVGQSSWNFRTMVHNFFQEGRPRLFYGSLLDRFAVHRLAKVWLSFVCCCPSAKPGNEVECGFYVGWVRMQVQFEAVCGPKFMSFWDDVGHPS